MVRFWNLLVCCFVWLTGICQVWQPLPDWPITKRDDGVGVVVNNRAYFGTGLQEWNATIDFRALNLQNDTWESISNMPHQKERQYACAFAGTDCFFVTCGTGLGGARNDTWKYHITTDSWSEVAPKPGQGLIGAQCLQFDQKILLVGGKFDNGQLSNECWQYDIPANSWTQKNNFPFAPVWRGCASTANDKGYLLFGVDAAGKFRNELYEYDPATDSWTAFSNFPSAPGRAYAAMSNYKGRLFVFAGMDSLQNYYGDNWFFDPATAIWHRGPDIPGTARRGGMYCGTGGMFYYVAGLSPQGRLTEAWKIDIPLGLERRSAPLISVYPNPVSDLLNLSAPYPEYSVNVFDFQGRLVCALRSESVQMQINCAAWPAGVYYLIFKNRAGASSGTKIIKE